VHFQAGAELPCAVRAAGPDEIYKIQCITLFTVVFDPVVLIEPTPVT
jgi:hypothetical protein